MIPEFKRYIDIPYKFTNGPDSLVSGSLDEGVNCQTLVHEMLKSFGITLHRGMLSKEIYEDYELFADVEGVDEAKFLDIFIFGRDGEKDPKKFHLAVCTGDDEKRDLLLIHANGVQKKVSVWPLKQFSDYPQYEKIYAIKRVRRRT